MNPLIFISLILALISSCKVNVEYETHVNERIKKEIHTTKKDTITFIIDYWDNLKIRSKVPYNSSNQMHGKAVWYHDNGSLWIEAEYYNRKKNGKFQYNYNDSTIQETAFYKMDSSNNIVKHWYTNGLLKFKYKFKLGSKVGKWQYWDEEGNLIKEEWYDKGTLLRTETYAIKEE